MGLPDLLSEGDDALGFWTRLARSERRFLGLDYDGTLAPFRVERLEAAPAPGAVEAVEALLEDRDTHIAVISGRRVEEVRQLLGPLPVLMVGSHGFERLLPGGPLERKPLEPAQRDRLDLAARQATELGLAHRLERKAASLALHTRGEAGERARALEARIAALWSPGCAEARLSCRPFDGGLELRAEGVDKGKVLEGLLESCPGALAVHIGDDRTDEDAFQVLRQRGGVGVKVGQHDIGRTAATGWLPDCDAVVEFLRKWKTTTAR